MGTVTAAGRREHANSQLIDEIISGRCCDRDRVAELVRGGAGVNARNIYGRSAFSTAARYGRTEVMKALKDLGANVNSMDDDGSTAMHEAALCGRIEAIRLLNMYGCDLNAANNLGITPLHNAILDDNSQTINELYILGANIYPYTGLTLPVFAQQHNKINAAAALERLYLLDTARR